jgi:Coenzyme PQQ synthesis protein D (PqqD)
MGNDAFELTETAQLAWSSIDGARTVAEIAGILRANYDVDEGTAIADVCDLLGTLARAGLVEY